MSYNINENEQTEANTSVSEERVCTVQKNEQHNIVSLH